MTRSARAAALRSTALATKSGARPIGAGRACRAQDSLAPSRKFRCRSRGRSPASVVPKSAPSGQHARTARAPKRRRWRLRQPRQPRDRARSCAASPGARDAPACRLAAAAQAGGAGGGGRDVVDLAGRRRRAGKRHRAGAQAQAGRCHAGAGRDIGSGRHASSRNGSSCAAKTMARRSSAIAPSFRPIRAGLRRPSCAGASRRRCGTTIATTPRCGRGSRTNRRFRPRASSRWRGC